MLPCKQSPKCNGKAINLKLQWKKDANASVAFQTMQVAGATCELEE